MENQTLIKLVWILVPQQTIIQTVSMIQIQPTNINLEVTKLHL